jgi:glycerol-3-phosphate O-acyltransferase / dihydroxyacetone phosphate acyltransferase
MNELAAPSPETGSTEKANFGYRLVRKFLSFWINRFFRDVEIHRASDVQNGPVIFVINHPNNLIDTFLVSYTIKRKIHYLATAQMFRNKILSLFLHNMGIIPVYRKQDDSAYADKNVSTFQVCFKVLNNGGAIGIYPEGVTHAERRVRKIKTGAARIALEAEDHYHPGILLIPIGLNYSARKSFRSEVIVNIGTPIPASDYVLQYRSDPVTAVDRLTSDLQKAMEDQVVHVDTPELERFVRNVERIYKAELIHDLMKDEGISSNEVDSFQLSKKLIDAIDYFNHRDPERLVKFQQEMDTYLNRLKTLRLQDETLRHLAEDKNSYRSFLLRILFLLIGFPFALWGSLNHFFPYHISRWISRWITEKETDYATVRILCGIVLYPIFYAFQIYWTWMHYGWTAALFYGITLPIFGAFAYYYWDRFKEFRVSLQLFFVMLTRRQLIYQLKERREKLVHDLDQAKEEYLNAQA